MRQNQHDNFGNSKNHISILDWVSKPSGMWLGLLIKMRRWQRRVADFGNWPVWTLTFQNFTKMFQMAKKSIWIIIALFYSVRQSRLELEKRGSAETTHAHTCFPEQSLWSFKACQSIKDAEQINKVVLDKVHEVRKISLQTRIFW